MPIADVHHHGHFPQALGATCIEALRAEENAGPHRQDDPAAEAAHLPDRQFVETRLIAMGCARIMVVSGKAAGARAVGTML
jgi:hypothetical protein